MKKNILKYTLIALSILAISALTFSFGNKTSASTSEISMIDSPMIDPATAIQRERVEAAAALASTLNLELNLQEKGLSQSALETALQGYLRLEQQGTLKNPDLLTIVDLSQSSRNKRFYLIDVKNNKLLVNTYVAHGKNSGLDSAYDFSNEINSEKSSLGFYVTGQTYRGKHGTSLRILGLDSGYNDNAEARGVVVHGANYVNEGRAKSAYIGRSQGCPALPTNNFKQVINLIKDGSALFVYYPSTEYLQNSDVLAA